MCNKIAVYGTLRYGAASNGFMEGAKHVGTDKIPARLYHLGWYPGVKIDPKAKTVVDVYEIPEGEEFLRRIDRYEGYAPGAPDQSLFRRVKVLLEDRNEEVYAYEYCYDVHSDNEIQTGDWFDVYEETTTR